ncbi:MAG TPA: EAL domain-containing protein [Pilimelia sp.]|nr:EAL domain-containing protein [Pilimelia sp.]
MTLLRRLRPDTALAKARLAGLLFAVASSAPNITQTYPGAGGTRQLVGSVAMAALVALYLVTYLRQRTFLIEPVIVATLIVAGGSSQRDPDAVIALCMGSLTLFSMHSSMRQAVVRLVLVIGALLVSVGISPAAHDLGMTWYAEQNITLMPMLIVMALLNAGVNLLLQRQQRAAARESLLARTGLDLINLTDLAEVRTIAERRFAEVCADWPGHTVLVARRQSGTAVVETAVSTSRDQTGTVASRDLTGTVASRDLTGTVLPLTGLPTEGTTTLTALDEASSQALDAAIGGRTWSGMAFGGEDDERALLVSGSTIPAAMADALRTMATYWSLAEVNCRTHAELGHRADSDQLTTLYNRRWFLQRLAAAREEATDGTSLNALLMIDLDDFKQVNDVYGHAAGDELLVQIADRITRAAGTTGWPARLGGDEFALLLTGLSDDAAVDRAAEALRESLLASVRLPDGSVTVGASIGIAIATPDLSAGDLMRCADIAMYSAKAKGKNRVERFTPAHHGSVAQLRRMEEHLAYAISRDEITVHFQPRVDLSTGRCLGLEALARWHDRAIGPVPPATFIPLAIRTGYIKVLGAHVLRTACERLADWHTDPSQRHLTMSVNVAAPQVYDPGFVDTVRRVLADSGVPAGRLILELTDEPAIDVDRAKGALTALAATGVRIALDDFGTGNASFTALRSFPVHQLKIHETLVAGASPTDHAMLQIVVAASVVLGLETVAECVETREQVDALLAAGVTMGQGFLFAHPMPAEAVTRWLPTAAPLPVE